MVKRLVPDSIPSSRYGKEPKMRSIEELLNLGVINLDKPRGPTSHQVSSWVKDIFNIEKAGHSGTLDPKVTGVLPIALNSATKALDVLLLGKKEYVGVMRTHQLIDEKKILKMFKEFEGEIYQTPPLRSAVKRQLRKRTIYRLDVIEIDKRDVLFKALCEPGTYMRTLCYDIGEALGIGAHMQELRRTKSGPFDEKNSHTLHELKDAFVYWKENDDEEELRKIILPMEEMFKDMPKIVVKHSAVDAICHGANLAIPGIMQTSERIKKGDVVSLTTEKGEGIAIGKALMTSSEMLKNETGTAIKTMRVLMEPGTYPKMWKTKQ